MDSEDYFLKTTVLPVKYTLKFVPDLTKCVFSGTEVIDVSVIDETTEVALHSRGLVFSSVSVHVGDSVVPSEFSVDEERQLLKIHLAAPIEKGSADVKIHTAYEGVLDDSMAGFYRSKYKASTGEYKYMGITQFEPADARKAFPCWDEPLRKAVFSITFVVDESLDVLSNMPPEKETRTEDHKKVIVFKDTPKMSTYLVAFAVGEFESVKAKTKHGVTVRILSPPGNKDKLKYALDIGTYTLDFFTDYFGIPYPLPKSDMLAVNDFAAGAMENWGLITFRLTALLANEQSSVAAQMRVAEVVSHELAHQWFGNLVTMRWWDNLWLNEGFATFLATFLVSKKCPQWYPWTDFVVQDVVSAHCLDALENTHPIQSRVETIEQIEEMFDDISYSKGGTVLRMLYHYIGDESFRAGLSDYLAKFSYSNACSEDLWDCWSKSSSRDVRGFMKVWTENPGFPFIEVTERGADELLLTQSRFYADGRAGKDDPIWTIPLRVSTDSAAYTEDLYVMQEKELVLPAPGKGKFVKLNRDQMSMVHIKYPDHMLQQIDLEQLTPTDRIGLVTDLVALVKAHKQSTRSLLQFLAKYKDEKSPIVWSKLGSVFDSLCITFRGEPAIVAAVKCFASHLALEPLKTIGWEARAEDSDLTKKMRATLIRLAGLSDSETISHARQLLEKATTLPNDLVGVILSICVRNGGADEWESVRKIFNDDANPAEVKIKALTALGANDGLLDKTMTWIFSGEVKVQDVYIIMNACSVTNPKRFMTWFFENWSTVKEKLKGVYMLFTRVIEISIAYLNDDDSLAAAERFFEENKEPAAAMTLKQSFEAIRNRIAWKVQDREEMLNWACTHDKH